MADQSTETRTVGCAQRLRLATWNCGGLSYTQRALCDELGYDVFALTETHDTGRLTPSRRFAVGEPAPAGDSVSGVALLLSERTAACVTHTLAALGHALFMCDCEPPPKTCSSSVFTFHTTSDGIRATLAELEALLENAPRGDCLLVMGDLNCRLPRSYGNRTGRWCIHTRANAGGLELLEMME